MSISLPADSQSIASYQNEESDLPAPSREQRSYDLSPMRTNKAIQWVSRLGVVVAASIIIDHQNNKTFIAGIVAEAVHLVLLEIANSWHRGSPIIPERIICKCFPLVYGFLGVVACGSGAISAIESEHGITPIAGFITSMQGVFIFVISLFHCCKRQCH